MLLKFTVNWSIGIITLICKTETVLRN